MTISILFFALAIVCVLVGVVSSIGITRFVAGHGVNINWLLLRLYMFRYIHEYHRMTKETTGKPGPFFYSYVISMNLALVFAFLAIIFR